MSTKINFKALAAELAELERQGKGHGEDLLIARVLHNMSPKRWEEFCQAYPASNWGAIPLSSLQLEHLAETDNDMELLGDDLIHAIYAEKFTEQVERELIRLGRVGGELSVICTQIHHDTPVEQTDELDEAMISVLRSSLETCDSMASDKTGRPLLLLPGTGPVRSRHMAEQYQKDFAATVKTPDEVHLVLGIVSIGQGENISAQELVEKVQKALSIALTKPNFLYQYVPETLDERSTLVHSDEKRFLFFGHG